MKKITFWQKLVSRLWLARLLKEKGAGYRRIAWVFLGPIVERCLSPFLRHDPLAQAKEMNRVTKASLSKRKGELPKMSPQGFFSKYGEGRDEAFRMHAQESEMCRLLIRGIVNDAVSEHVENCPICYSHLQDFAAVDVLGHPWSEEKKQMQLECGSSLEFIERMQKHNRECSERLERELLERNERILSEMN